MAKKESVQSRLGKVRPPRVHLTYDVQVGDAVEKKELPFVVGVLGEFGGQPAPDKPVSKVKDRKFVNVDLETLDDVMTGIAPRAAFAVENKLSETGGSFGVELEFRSMDDFRPEAVVQQIEPLRQLVEVRTRLSDLRNKLAGNEKLDDILSEILSNADRLQQLGADAIGRKEQA